MKRFMKKIGITVLALGLCVSSINYCKASGSEFTNNIVQTADENLAAVNISVDYGKEVDLKSKISAKFKNCTVSVTGNKYVSYKDGKIKGTYCGKGSFTVSATAADGHKIIQNCNISVKPVKVTGIKIKRSIYTVKKDAVLLQWNKQEGASYNVYKRLKKTGSKWKKVCTIKENVWGGVKYPLIQYVDTNKVQHGKTYKYKIIACSSVGSAKGIKTKGKKMAWCKKNGKIYFPDYVVLKCANRDRKKKGLKPYYWDFKLDKGGTKRIMSKYSDCHYIESYRKSIKNNYDFDRRPDFSKKYVDLFVDYFDYYQTSYCKCCGGDGSRVCALDEILCNSRGKGAFNQYLDNYGTHGKKFFYTGTEDSSYPGDDSQPSCSGHKGDYNELHAYDTVHKKGENNPGDVYGMSSWSETKREKVVYPKRKVIYSQGNNLTYFSLMKMY